MYESHFSMAEKPFSIAPDPDYLYMSTRHKEAMAHLSYGVMEAGGFALLTGEVGTGKTTLCRNLLVDLPKKVDVALILNPNINEIELLETICDELKIKYTPVPGLMGSASGGSQKKLLDLINKYLLKAFSKNRHTVLIIDEAQLLSRDVLELVRLLTNLETTKTKLLQIILIGQPELNKMLAREDLRQLSQRVTARYHLRSLDKSEIGDYINYRLTRAGCKQPMFSRQSLSKIYQYTKGTPRLINVLCHHALLSSYSKNQKSIDSKTITQVAKEIFPNHRPELIKLDIDWRKYLPYLLAGAVVLFVILLAPVVIKAVVSSIDTFNISREQTSQEASSIQQQVQPATIESINGKEQINGEPINEVKETVLKSQIILDEPIASEQTLIPEQPSAIIDDKALLDESVVENPVEQKNIAAVVNTKKMVEVLVQSKGKLGRIQSLRQLALLWNISLSDEIFDPLCDEVSKQGFACVIVNANWQELIAYNRPAVLELNNAEHVLLTELVEDKASIVVDEETFSVDMADLQQHWLGKAILFWRPTELGKQRFVLGDASSDVVWLRMTINQALSKQNLPALSSTINVKYDEEMVRKISLLQQQNNLKVDGIVGIQTYMLLNEILHSAQIPILK